MGRSRGAAPDLPCEATVQYFTHLQLPVMLSNLALLVFPSYTSMQTHVLFWHPEFLSPDLSQSVSVFTIVGNRGTQQMSDQGLTFLTDSPLLRVLISATCMIQEAYRPRQQPPAAQASRQAALPQHWFPELPAPLQRPAASSASSSLPVCSQL